MKTLSSQKADARSISFLLDNGVTDSAKNVNLVIRPEELTRSQASRTTVNQTFGGAWVDGWGKGLATIQISGHTGWRGGLTQDGMACFQQLKTDVWDGWHTDRDDAVKSGQDPSKVQLIFADTLDGIVEEVAPLNFTLKRSRVRPLLFVYQISMVVVNENPQPSAQTAEQQSGTSLLSQGLDSLTDAANRLEHYADVAKTWIEDKITGPIEDFLKTANGVMATVINTVAKEENALTTALSPIMGLATDIAQAGVNAMYTVEVMRELPMNIVAQIMGVSSAYEDALCVLTNVLQPSTNYPDYSPWYGANNCSSTAGGAPLSPLRTTNPFGLLNTTQPLPYSISPPASNSLAALKNSDPVQFPMDTSTLGLHLENIAKGISIL
jgi:hypothetical protein